MGDPHIHRASLRCWHTARKPAAVLPGQTGRRHLIFGTTPRQQTDPETRCAKQKRYWSGASQPEGPPEFRGDGRHVRDAYDAVVQMLEARPV